MASKFSTAADAGARAFAATTATGAASGILNGAFGTGGPPVVLFYFSTPAAAAVGRASVIAFFLSTDTLGLAELARNGLVTQQSFVQFVAWLPALLVGVFIGTKGFKHMDPAKFRLAVLWILIYGIPAVLTGVVAFGPDVLPSNRVTGAAFFACLAVAVAGAIYLWPSLPENWLQIELEREGFGLIIVTLALLVAGWAWRRRARSLPLQAAH